MAIPNDLVHEAGHIAQDFKGQVSKRPGRLLDLLARVARGEGDTKILAHALQITRLPRLGLVRRIASGLFGESVEVRNEIRDILVVCVGLETELVLDGDGKCGDEVESRAI